METIRRSFSVALACVSVFPLAAQNSEVTHRFVQVNGIRMHIAEQGQGPLVLLLHGFPELWYSSRHLLPALAAAGYHAVAPDMRGYGQTDAPMNIDDYSQLKIVSDVVGLVHALGYEQAVVSGHDWGAAPACNAANLRLDMFRAVVLLTVPFAVRQEGAIRPSEVNLRRVPEGKVFYQTYFQTPGVAEKEFEANPRRTFRIIFGSPPESGRTTNGLDPGRGVLDGREEPKQLPSWLKPEDIDYYVKEFSRTGFRGGLNGIEHRIFPGSKRPSLGASCYSRPCLSRALLIWFTSSAAQTSITWKRAPRTCGKRSCYRGLVIGPSKRLPPR